MVIKGHVDLFGFGIDSYDNMISQFIYAFNMPIFFFISGFFAYKEIVSNRILLSQIKNKFLFLVLPAVIFSIYMNIIKEREILGFVESGFGIYWFTITLFCCFIVYYAIRFICFSRNWQCVILLLLSIIGVVYLSVNLGEDNKIPLLDLNHLAKYFQYFAFGVIAKMYKAQYIKIISDSRFITIVTISFFVVLAIICQNQYYLPSLLRHVLQDLCLRYLATFLILSLFFVNKEVFNENNLMTRLISKIGRNSLAIYLLQYFFLPHFSKSSGFDMFTVNIISIGYTLLIAATCILFIVILSNSEFVRKYILGQKMP